MVVRGSIYEVEETEPNVNQGGPESQLREVRWVTSEKRRRFKKRYQVQTTMVKGKSLRNLTGASGHYRLEGVGTPSPRRPHPDRESRSEGHLTGPRRTD